MHSPVDQKHLFQAVVNVQAGVLKYPLHAVYETKKLAAEDIIVRVLLKL
jgi:hypothetical protein